jgi:hypothetical protein
MEIDIMYLAGTAAAALIVIVLSLYIGRNGAGNLRAAAALARRVYDEYGHRLQEADPQFYEDLGNALRFVDSMLEDGKITSEEKLVFVQSCAPVFRDAIAKAAKICGTRLTL